MDCQLKLRCLKGSCKDWPPIERSIDKLLIPAIVTGFHAEHEGHPLELSVDGEIIHSGRKVYEQGLLS